MGGNENKKTKRRRRRRYRTRQVVSFAIHFIAEPTE
jgi:hypothetical protein